MRFAVVKWGGGLGRLARFTLSPAHEGTALHDRPVPQARSGAPRNPSVIPFPLQAL